MNLLKKYRLKPKHSLGQNFLTDESVLQREIAYAELTRQDTVFEIGPGIGNLTARLAAQAGRVIALEKDRQFLHCLEDLKRQHTNLELLWGDALQMDFPVFDKVVANLPYKVALPLLFKILDRRFNRAVLIFQESLARRIGATVGEPGYCRLSVSMGRKARIDIIETIPGTAFFPPADVQSALVHIERLKPRFGIPSEAFFRLVLEALFTHRDKSLAQAVHHLKHPGLSPNGLSSISTKLKNKLVSRLTPKEFGQLTWAFWETGGRDRYEKRRD